MRVSIEHKEQTSGVTGARKDTYVVCTVLFTEEEKAIIKQRDLYQNSFSVDAATKLDSSLSFVGSGVIRIVGVVMTIGGFIVGMVIGLAHGDPSLPTFIMFAGIGVAIWGWLRGRKQDKRIENPRQEISIKKLLHNPTFTVHAGTPAYAKAVENGIRDGLKTFKYLITQSAELREKQVFDL